MSEDKDDKLREPRSLLEFLQAAREEDEYLNNTESSSRKKASGAKNSPMSMRGKNGIKYPEETNPIWIDREGKRHPVGTMDTKHIIAVLGVFERFNMTGDNIKQWKDVFNNELRRRGEI